jgi:hypothetical protein
MRRVSALSLILLSPAALAQKKPPPLEGAKLLADQHPDKGYVDDGFALDGAGGRLALVRTDGASWAEVEVLDLAHASASLAKFDLAALTMRAIHVDFVGADRLFVVGRPMDGEKATGWLVDLHGKKLATYGPASEVVLAEGGKEVTAWDSAPKKNGGTTYDVTVYSTAGNAPVHRTLDADADGLISSIGLQVIYWRDGFTQIVGRKLGAYDKFKDQRMNDSEGIYDLVGGNLARDTVLTDVIGWTKLMKVRAGRNTSTLLTISEDLTKLLLVTPDNKQLTVTLADTLDKYDPKSLVQELSVDGKLYASLTIDPYNAAAVDRKVADPEYIDFYAIDAGTGQASRIARLPKADRDFAWRISAGRLIVLRRSKGFSQGGPDLEIYDLGAH